MTTDELIDYYASLLILQYANRTKAPDTIRTLVKPVIMDKIVLDVQDAYNMFASDVAEGVQLDVIGKYVGVSRMGNTFTGPITLDDANFLVLIQLGIINNSAESSLAAIQDLLHTYFEGQIFVFDYSSMRLSYILKSSVGSEDLAEMIITQGLLPKPMGVQLSSVIYVPVIDQFFGFRTYSLVAENVNPFNTYSDYQMDWPWLSYADALTL